MKNLYKYLLAVATVAMAFTSCSKDEISDPSIEVQKVTFTVTSGSDLETPPASRTEFDEETGQMNWSADGEALEVIQILGSEISHATTEAYTIDNRIAKFQVSFDALTGSEPYDLTYSAIYPAANYSDNTNDHTKFRIKLPAAQTPTETGFDPNADLLLAKPETRTVQPAEGEELSFRFKRVAAIVKMTLKGIPAGEKLAKVELTASQPMAGYSRTDLKTGEIYDIGYYKEETMTLTLNDRETTGKDVIWFTSLPCVFGEGDSFTVKAYTDKATYEKTVSFSTPEAFKFVSGGLTRFGITGMTRTENAVDEYVLLTNVADLSVGDQIIITSGTDGAVKALSTEQKSNNRGATDIEIASNTITTIPANAQIITMETGMVANTFAFHVEGDVTGYLYAASSSKNYLKTQDNIDGNASWTIDVAESGVATIKAQGDYTRNLLQYNNSNTLFSCYSSKQQDVYIFYKAGSPKTALDAPTNVETTLEDANTVYVGWDAVQGAASYTVSFEPATIEPLTIESTGAALYTQLFTLDYATDYTVSVVANPADTENYKASAPATATFTTGENPNVTYTQIKDLVKGETVAIKDALVVATSTRGPILWDETGAILAYQPSETPAIGSVVTVNATVGEYNKALQLNDATFTVTGTTEVPTQTATEVTAANIDDLMTVESVTVTYVKFTGTLNISGSYYNVVFPFETNYQGSLYYPDAEALGLAVLNGREVNVEGWFTSITTYGESPKYLNVVATQVSSASEAPYITADETASFVAAGETKTINFMTDNLGENQVFATISGDGAGQFSVGQIEAEFVTVTALENTETTAKTATLTLYIAASEGGEHLDEATVTLTQAGVPSGEGPAIGTVLWAETWTGGTAGETPSKYGQEGTTVYNNAPITYNQTSTNTKLYAEKLAGGTAPELLLSRNNQTWTISGIPFEGVTSAVLTMKANNESRTEITYYLDGTGDGVTAPKGVTATINNTSNAKTVTIEIKNTSSSNVRLDDIELKVTN